MANKKILERREFLKGTAAAGGAVALGMVSGHAIADSDEDKAPEKKESKGYHLTQHIRDYYRTARS